MSAQNAAVSWVTRYKITNGGSPTWFACTSADINNGVDPADITDSESLGSRLRKAGVAESEITLSGNIQSDVNPHSAPLNIQEGGFIARLDVYYNGSGNTPDTYLNVFVQSWRKTSGPNLSDPAHFTLHGFSSSYTPGQ